MIVDDLHDSLFPKLKRVWEFHPWFIVKTQVRYLTHICQTGHFDVKKQLVQELEITLKEVIRFLKIIFLIFKWHRKHRNTYAEEVLIAGYKHHRYDIGGEKINLYMDPFHRLVKELDRNALLFFFDSPSSENAKSTALYQYYKYLTFFYEVALKLQIKLTFYGRRQLKQLKENESVLKAWLREQRYQEADRLSSIVTYAVLKNEIAFRAFDNICKFIKPKLVWSYCFYDNDTSAFSRAARKHGIRFVDYQHSQQSDTHFAYSRWEDIDTVIDFFPSTFWVWRKADKKRLTQNFAGRLYKPECIHGGNLYLSSKKIQNQSERQNNAILVSLQGQWIPAFLEDFVKTESKFEWYFRLHPRYSADKEKLLMLKSECGSKVKFEEANVLSLYEIFAKVTFNITSYSGVAMEANEFGVKNIIFGEKGYVTFKDYIDEKVFEYITDMDSLRLALDNPQLKESSESTVQSYASIVSNLNHLILASGK